MAEAVIVNIVVGKLANIIANEINFLGGVGEKVKKAQRELTRIQCCLRDADSKRKGDESVQNWLNELRDVAYRIEDAIDTFFLKVECNQNPSFLQTLKKVSNMPWEAHLLHKLGTKLNSIQIELEEISKSRVAYGIIALHDIEVGEAVILPFRRATYSEVDETEVIGLRADKNNILKLLRREETPRRAVITIVGTGGLGKTTLAHMIYKSARAEFEYHIMLSVSQQFSLTELLKRMLRRQLIDSKPKEQDVEDLNKKKEKTDVEDLNKKKEKKEKIDVEDLNKKKEKTDVEVLEDLMSELKKNLSSRRYLIILDDVWQVDVWNQLKDALPDVKNGSRVLITSRSIDVAISADPNMAPYELNLLDDKQSLDLLLKKVHSKQEPNEELPSNLLKLADELSKKCKGLPLALIIVGGILITKGRNYHAWERVLRTMDWHSEGRECMDVLAMSYEDMPYYLKACFLYLALFPEDYQISARRLIRMWVAEGFIPQEERKTMEEIAEDYLYELFQRSMIQVSSRHVNGSIKCFQVHDLLRDLAMHKAREENFVMVFSKESDSKKPNKEIRRASFHSLKSRDDSHWCNNLSYLEYAGPNVRSVILFGYGWTQIPNFRKFRLLKVLELEGVGNNDVDLVRGLDKLIHLKYLGLRRCQIPIWKCSFHRMKALETLDIRGMVRSVDGYNKVPNGLWSIDTLRHVMCHSPFTLPKKTAKLKNIQTMQWVYFDKKMPLLSNLCKLGIIIPYGGHLMAFTSNLFATLPFLVSLSILSVDSLTMEVVYPKALPNYQHLQSLYLNGVWSENVTLDASLFPPHLLKLTLVGSRFKQNPMPELGKLKNLKKLCLEEEVLSNYPYNFDPIFCPAGFPVLQYLKLGKCSVKSLPVAEGAMPNLKYLNVYNHDIKFHLPHELQHVSITFERDD